MELHMPQDAFDCIKGALRSIEGTWRGYGGDMKGIYLFVACEGAGGATGAGVVPLHRCGTVPVAVFHCAQRRARGGDACWLLIGPCTTCCSAACARVRDRAQIGSACLYLEARVALVLDSVPTP